MNPINHLKLIRDNPGVYNFISDEQLADILLQLVETKRLFKKAKLEIKNGKDGKDGKTPKAGVDYMSREQQEELLRSLVASLPEPQAGKDGQDGLDGADAEITEEDIQFIVDTVYDALFPQLPIPLTSEEVRDRLELLLGDERLDKKAIRGIEEIEEAIEELRNRPIGKGGGGLGRRQVQDLINTAIAAIPTSTNTWSYYNYNWSVEPTLNSSIAGGDVYNYTLDGTTRYRFIPTAYDPTQDAFYSSFSAGTLSGLIVTRG